jgi:hypothetical protein
MKMGPEQDIAFPPCQITELVFGILFPILWSGSAPLVVRNNYFGQSGQHHRRDPVPSSSKGTADGESR